MSTLRKQLADALAPLLPARKYRIVPGLNTLDKIAKPTIQFEQADIEPSPSARGAALVTIRIHVITERASITPAADDAIDALGIEVFEALAGITFANPTIATKAIFNETNLSYVITTQIITKRSTP